MKNEKLPENLGKYFWDCNFEDLKIDQYEVFISERILNFGDMDSLKWLFGRINKRFLIDVVNTSRNLNKKTRSYWLTILS